jgi:DNA-binding CsgD family transcriptional regulator
MAAAEDSEAFESAVSRLPYPVFVVDSGMRLRAMNPQARALWTAERLHEQWLQRPGSHPLAEVIGRVRKGQENDDDTATVQLAGVRYEVIHSTRSPKGQGRWLVLMLRPFPTALGVDQVALRKRWSLTPREAEVAAASITGWTTAEICAELSIARETFKTHMRRILSKSGCENRSQLIAEYLFGQ